MRSERGSAVGTVTNVMIDLEKEGLDNGSHARQKRREALRDRDRSIDRRFHLANASLDRSEKATALESSWRKWGTIGGAIFGVLTQGSAILSGDPTLMLTGAALFGKDVYLGGLAFGEKLGKLDSKNHRLAAADLRAESKRVDIVLEQARTIQTEAEQELRLYRQRQREAAELERDLTDHARRRTKQGGRASLQDAQKESIALEQARIRELMERVREEKQHQFSEMHRRIDGEHRAERNRVRAAAYRAGLDAFDTLQKIVGVALSYFTGGNSAQGAGVNSAGLNLGYQLVFGPVQKEAARAEKRAAEHERGAIVAEHRAKEAAERIDQGLDELQRSLEDIRRYQGRA